MCPGPWGPEEQLLSRWSSARPGGSRGAGYWHLDGLKQRLRPQPSQGPWASLVYVHCWLGSGCFQVSGFTQEFQLFLSSDPSTLLLHINMYAVMTILCAGLGEAGGGYL